MKRKRTEYLVEVPDDGLPAAEVGRWSEEKYRILGMYADLFSTGMKNKWGSRVYIDLFAGPGHAVIRGTAKRVLTSPLLALRVPDRFDKYIYCDEDAVMIGALEKRARTIAPVADIEFLCGDANGAVERVIDAIPRHGHGATVLNFCFLDPYDLGLHLETVQRLGANRAMDFLILLALGTDANRNEITYLQPDREKVDRFLGDPGWRGRWSETQTRDPSFTRFLAEEYSAAMRRIGYLAPGIGRMFPVKNAKNVPLYYLAFFSRNELGFRFWDQVLKYVPDQLSLLDT